MQRFIISICCIITGLSLGILFKKRDARVNKQVTDTLPQYMVLIRSSAVLIMNPILMLLLFWIVDWSNIKMITLPVMGVLALITGGIFGIMISKVLGHDKKHTGSMFAVSSFSNLGTAGGLAGYMFFGEPGVVFVTMYKLFEEIYYYTIGFSAAHFYRGEDDRFNPGTQFKKILKDPYVVVYIMAFIVGTLLNLSGVKRPDFFGNISEFLIIFNSLFYIMSIGYTMRLSKGRSYRLECVCVCIIKFIIIPAFVIVSSLLLGLRYEGNGLLFPVLIIVSMAPPAFNSLITAQIYGLDIDLANICWAVCTVLYLIFVLPTVGVLLYLGVL